MTLCKGLGLPKGPGIEGDSWPPTASVERAPALLSRVSGSLSTEMMRPTVSVRMSRGMLLLCRAGAPGAEGNWLRSSCVERRVRVEAEPARKAAKQDRPGSPVSGGQDWPLSSQISPCHILLTYMPESNTWTWLGPKPRSYTLRLSPLPDSSLADTRGAFTST